MQRPVTSRHQRYLWWLGLVSLTMAVAMAVMLVLQFTQKQSIRRSGELRVDSIAAITFQLEREFLRFRQTLDKAAQGGRAPDQDALLLRFDIFVSRLALLRDNPTIALLSERSEYQQVVPQLEQLITRTEAALGNARIDQVALRPLLQDYNALGADVQALSFAATSQVSHTIERQEEVMLGQNEKIMWLTGGQFLLLVFAAVALVIRQRRQEQERQALEKLTAELKHAHMLAEAGNRSKSLFLATISHELRTPFNGMLGMLGMLESTALTTAQTDYVRTARDSADQLLGLLNDILDVSALDSGKLKLQGAPLNLQVLLEEVQTAALAAANAKGIGFTLVKQGQLPLWVQGDANRMRQVLLNLVSNAVKFSHQGQITLRVVADGAVRADSASSVQFEVQDQGIGMDAETMSRLFRRFSQGDASISRRFGGTGLGLEISRGLAHLMGGSLTVQSELGVGSCFRLSLPLYCIEAPREASNASAFLPSQLPHATSLDILVAEDHPVNRKYMQALLTKLGHRPRFAEDGVQAVAEVRRALPDIVLMDLHMPEMDGFEATKVLRAEIGSAQALPIVALTADAYAETRERALAAGMNAFLSKPVRSEQIVAMLDEVLQLSLRSQVKPAGALAGLEPAQLRSAETEAEAARELERRQHERRQLQRREFHAADALQHLDMNLVAEVCLAVSLKGYRDLLSAFFDDHSGAMASLLQSLEASDRAAIPLHARTVRNAAADLGLHALAQLAARMEQADTSLDSAAFQQASEQLRELLAMARNLCARMGLTQETVERRAN